MMSGDMKLSIAPLSTRASTSDINCTDLRLMEVCMEEFLESKMASENTALSIATCCEPTENLFLGSAFLQPIALSVSWRVWQCRRLGIQCIHLHLGPLVLWLLLRCMPFGSSAYSGTGSSFRIIVPCSLIQKASSSIWGHIKVY